MSLSGLSVGSSASAHCRPHQRFSTFGDRYGGIPGWVGGKGAQEIGRSRAKHMLEGQSRTYGRVAGAAVAVSARFEFSSPSVNCAWQARPPLLTAPPPRRTAPSRPTRTTTAPHTKYSACSTQVCGKGGTWWWQSRMALQFKRGSRIFVYILMHLWKTGREIAMVW